MKLLQLLSVAIIFASTCSYAQETMDATKKSHSSETMSVKELDAFHELLHPLVHEAYPNKDFSTIRKAIPDLIAAAKKLKNASLPKELKTKEFKKNSSKLLKELTALNKKKDKLTDEEFGKKFMEMHDTFESVMELMQ